MTAALDEIELGIGAHPDREQGVCLMEAVAWMAGEEHSDHPQCVDVALGAYGRALNDRLRDDERQWLRPLIRMLIGTRGSDELARRRAYYLVDSYFRVQLSAFFRELPSPRPDLAERFEALSPVIDATSIRRARDLALEVRADIWRSLPADAYAYADADAYAVAYADAGAAYADAAAYAADGAYAYDDAAATADAAAFAAAAYAAGDAADADLQELRRKTIERAISAFREAIAISDTEV